MGELSFGAYRLDTHKARLYHQDQPLELEPQIYGILELLITRHGEIVSRDDMIEAVWDGHRVSNNVINNRVKSARVAISDSGTAQRWIKTYPNRGYKFIGDVRLLDEAAYFYDSKNSIVPQATETKSAMPLLRKAALPLAGALLFGMVGLYAFSQSTKTTSDAVSVNVEATNNQDIYRLAASDEINALPRVAVLPFETIGDRAAYGYMPEVFKSQFNNVITAIKDITVVSLLTGSDFNDDFVDYKTLKGDFGLDYVIASEISAEGEGFKLNTLLLNLNDNSIVFNENFDLKSSAQEWVTDSVEDIAVKVTLLTANKLNLSMDGLPSSWKNYNFNVKMEQAIELQKNGDYQSLKEAVKLFREAVEEEPNYLPAYAWLLSTLSWMGTYSAEGDEMIGKEVASLAKKMKEVSPEAPETLLINSFMDSLVDGVKKETLGEYDETDPQSVMKYILKKDPDNLQALSMVADMSAFVKEQSDTVKAYENLIRLAPTHPWYLMEYSRAIFCNGELDRARAIIDRTGKWHPNNRFALLAQLREFNALGQYEDALITLKRIMDQGILAHEDTISARNLFYDLGHPELALPHVRFPPARAHAHAMVDDKEAALEAAAIIRSFHTSVRSRMIVDDDYFPEDYSPYRTYARVGHPDGVTKANTCRLDYLARDIYVLRKINSEKFELLLPLLTAYFEGNDPKSLKTQQEYLGLIGLHVIQSDFDKAIEVMDIAMDKGFLFIGSFKDPHLRELTAYPGFEARLERMQKKADLLIEMHYLN